MDDFEALLPYFERELNQLRQDMLQFERKHPAAAARLSMSGGQTSDPHVESMLQRAALLNARASMRIDDHYPEFTDAIIETVFPAYLRPIPSCSIAQCDVAGMFDGLTHRILMPRGTALEHRPSLCKFNTVWDVTLSPLGIMRAQFLPPTSAPVLPASALPSDMAGIVSIEFAAPDQALTSENERLPQKLRLYLHGDRFLAAALVDALLLHPQTAFVEADGSRRWQALESSPASAVGFADDEAIIDEARHTRDRFECTNPSDPPSIVRASSYACPKPWSLARARRAVLQNIRRVVGLGRRRAQRRRQRDDDKRPSFVCSEHNCRPGRGARASTIRRLETSSRIIECRMG